jgi:hypothetical protein
MSLFIEILASMFALLFGVIFEVLLHLIGFAGTETREPPYPAQHPRPPRRGLTKGYPYP